jgi:hypothetical protein
MYMAASLQIVKKYQSKNTPLIVTYNKYFQFASVSVTSRLVARSYNVGREWIFK